MFAILPRAACCLVFLWASFVAPSAADAGGLLCGDGRCTIFEFASCPEDCARPVCGDGTCHEDEDCSSCKADCGECAATCGCNNDGICNAGEDCTTCPGDCASVGLGKAAYCCGENQPHVNECGKDFGAPYPDSDGDGTLDCFDDCPLDPFKTSPGERGCGLEDPDRQTVDAGLPAALHVSGASLEIPADALQPGTEVSLEVSPIHASGFDPAEFPDEIPMTDVFVVRVDPPQHARDALQLHIEVPAPVPPGFYGRMEGQGEIGAGPDAVPRWFVDVGHFDDSTSVLTHPILAASESTSFVTVTTTYALTTPPPPPPSLPLWSLPSSLPPPSGVIALDWDKYPWAVWCLPEEPCATSNAPAEALAQRLLQATSDISEVTGGLNSGVVERVTAVNLHRLMAAGIVVGFAAPGGTSLDDYGAGGDVLIAHVVSGVVIPDASGSYTGGRIRFSETVVTEVPSVSLNDTVVHELFHAVQRRYSGGLAPWIREGLADAVMVGTLLSDPAERASHRRWRDWSKPLEESHGKHKYDVAEFFLHYHDGSLLFLPTFLAVVQATPVFAVLHPYVDADTALGGGLEERYLDMIVARSQESGYPYWIDWTCTVGSSCTGTNDQQIDSMSAPAYRVTIDGGEPGCPPGQDLILHDAGYTFSFTTSASKMSMIVDVGSGPTIVGAGVPVDVPVSTFDAWIVWHDKQANLPGSFAFVAGASPDYECVECGDGICDPSSEDSVSCPSDCFCGDSVCDPTEDEASCPADCLCGNGWVEGSEQCDDGNQTGADGCGPTCLWEGPHCDNDGDGTADVGYYECGPICCSNLQWCFKNVSSTGTNYACSSGSDPWVGVANYCDNWADLWGPGDPSPCPPTAPYAWHGCYTSTLSAEDEEFPFGKGTCSQDSCKPLGATCP